MMKKVLHLKIEYQTLSYDIILPNVNLGEKNVNLGFQICGIKSYLKICPYYVKVVFLKKIYYFTEGGEAQRGGGEKL